MVWIKFTLETTTAATDILSYELQSIGIEGIEIHDNISVFDEERAKKYGEIPPDSNLNIDDDTAILHFYLEPPCDIQNIMDKVNEILQEVSAYCSVGKGSVIAEETADIDWVANWKQYFKPFRATENIVIKPTWEAYKKEFDTDILIEIDPDIAFGTGSHETTLLCLKALQAYVKPSMNMLDIGCGSGILSIAAIKLGAKRVTAIDIDETAIDIAIKNRKINRIEEEKLHIFASDIFDDKNISDRIDFSCYDIVVANLLADIIIPLSSMITSKLKKDVIYITSGIINTKEIEVRKALLKNNFTILDTLTQGEWVSFICLSSFSPSSYGK